MEFNQTDWELADHFDRSVAALVLNFGEYPFLHGTLGIVRSLGRLGIPVFVVQRFPFLPSGASRYLTGKFLWAADGRNTDQFLEGMARIAKILDRPTILMPADDSSAILIAKNANALAEWFIFVRQPETLPRTLANKRNLYQSIVSTVRDPVSFDNVSADARGTVCFLGVHAIPVMAKATEPWLLPNGFKSVAKVARLL
jgi:D-aspartate ligase